MTPSQALLRSLTLDWIPVTEKLPPIKTAVVMKAAECWCARKGDVVSAVFNGNRAEVIDGAVLVGMENSSGKDEIYNYLGRATHWIDATKKG